jgi:hypothetical protein
MASTPIIPGFYPDPSVCRVGDQYFLATSSFEYSPGVPVWRSDDLLTWEQIGHVLDRPSQLPHRAGRPSGGIFAPTLRHHGGRFWMVTTDYHRIFDGQLIVWADDPAGPWSDPVFTTGATGIDPDLAWDEDGTCHMTWASFEGIRTAPIDPLTGTLLGESHRVWPGTGMVAAEGPHLYRVDGWWYLLLAEGGTERGHAITIARSRTLDGEWESAPNNPILSHRSSGHPVQNTGHGDQIHQGDGSWALVHRGVRPRGFSPLFHTNGRETFLAGVDWVDGWPVVDEDRFAVPAVDTSFVDSFDRDALDLRWIAPGRGPDSFTKATPEGLVIQAPGAGQASQLCVRVRDLAWEATAELAPGTSSGRFSVRLDDRHWYGLEVEGNEVRAVAAIGPLQQVMGSTTRPGAGPLALRITSTPPGKDAPDREKHEPDHLVLSVVRPDGTAEQLARLPGRYLSTEVACGFTGRVLSVEATHQDVTLRRVTYTGLEG